MMELDKKDQQLLNLLRANARLSIVELSKKLNLSRATVQNRINKLESRKVILGYTVMVGSETNTPEVRAIMSIEAESAKEELVISKLRGSPHITAVHHTTGQWDLIAEIQANSLSSFNKIISSIRLIEGVTATETNLLLDSYA